MLVILVVGICEVQTHYIVPIKLNCRLMNVCIMSLSIIQLKDSDLLIYCNMLLVGLMILVGFAKIMYVDGNILLIVNTYGIRGYIYLGTYV